MLTKELNLSTHTSGEVDESVNNLEWRLDNKIKVVKDDFKQDIREVKDDLKEDIKEVKQENQRSQE